VGDDALAVARVRDAPCERAAVVGVRDGLEM
jgi:hypothetical protein